MAWPTRTWRQTGSGRLGRERYIAIMATTTAHPNVLDRAEVNLASVATYLVPAGRVLFAAIFILSAFGHFTRPMIEFAASQGVPAASFLVPASGVLALLGGLSVALGYHARLGAILIVLFLLPVTFMMHAFWAVDDPMMAKMQQAMFMKNLSMMGGALLIMYFGAGPISLDSRQKPVMP
jgi:putative oxidoreductase